MMDGLAGNDFASGLQSLRPFTEACHKRDPLPMAERTATAGLQEELAICLDDPAHCAPDRVREWLDRGAKPGSGPEAMPWYPAATAGEVAFVKWVLEAASGQLADTGDLPRLAGMDARRHPDIAARIEQAGQGRRCIQAWTRARRGGEWRQVDAACSAAELPPVVAACLLAERSGSAEGAGLFRMGGLVRAARSAEAEFDCGQSDPCRVGAGFEQLLFPIPAATPRTYTGLALLASRRAQKLRCLDRIPELPAGLRWLYEWAGAREADERAQLVALLDANDAAEVADAIAGCTSAATDPPALACAIEHAGTVALSLAQEQAVALACQLVGLPVVAGPAGASPTWQIALPIDERNEENRETRLADLAIHILDRFPVGDDPQGLGCRLTGLVRRAAVRGARSRQADLRAAEQILERLARVPGLALAARTSRCELAAGLGKPERAAADVRALFRQGEVGSARRCAVGAVLGGLRRCLAVDALLADGGPLTDWLLDELRVVRNRCPCGGACEPSPKLQDILEPPDEVEPVESETDDEQGAGEATEPS